MKTDRTCKQVRLEFILGFRRSSDHNFISSFKTEFFIMIKVIKKLRQIKTRSYIKNKCFRSTRTSSAMALLVDSVLYMLLTAYEQYSNRRLGIALGYAVGKKEKKKLMHSFYFSCF